VTLSGHPEWRQLSKEVRPRRGVAGVAQSDPDRKLGKTSYCDAAYRIGF
jgi:hypothetical protein